MKTNTLLWGCALAGVLFFSVASTHGSTKISGSDVALTLSGSTEFFLTGQVPDNAFRQSASNPMGSPLLSVTGSSSFPEGMFVLGMSTAQGSDGNPINVPGSSSHYVFKHLFMDRIIGDSVALDLTNGGFRVQESGWYLLMGKVLFAWGIATGGQLGLHVTINAFTDSASIAWQPMRGGDQITLVGTRIVYLNANDLVRLSVKHYSPPAGYVAKICPNSEFGRDWHATLSGFRLNALSECGGGGGILDGGTASNLTINNLFATGTTTVEELIIQAPAMLSNTGVTAWLQGNSETNSFNWGVGTPTQQGFFGITGSQVSINDPVGPSETYVLSLTDAGLILAAGGANGRISFRSGGYSPAQERMILTPEGKLGIGVSQPQQALDIQENAHVSGNTAISGSMSVTGNVTVSGSLTVGSGIRVEPQGDLLMGEYTADPANAGP